MDGSVNNSVGGWFCRIFYRLSRIITEPTARVLRFADGANDSLMDFNGLLYARGLDGAYSFVDDS